jgi:hypothetical protein
VVVGLTPEGLALEERAAAVQREAGAATGLRDAEIAALRMTLRVLTGALRAPAAN